MTIESNNNSTSLPESPALCPKCNGLIKTTTESCFHCNAWLGSGSVEKPLAIDQEKAAELAADAERNAATSATEKNSIDNAKKAAAALAGSVFAKAKGLADNAVKTATSDTTKQNLNDAAKTANVMAGKLFAKAKGVAEDVKKELGEVNSIRKETFANASAGKSKKELAKGFWAKLSGKQKGLLAGIAAICVYFSYSIIFTGDSERVVRGDKTEVGEVRPTSKYCLKLSGLSQFFAESVASDLRVSSSSISFVRAELKSDGSCYVTIDTPKGPKSCLDAGAFSVYSTGSKYIVYGTSAGCY